MSYRRYRLRTIHVGILDRQVAEAVAISRVIESGARWAYVRSCERIADHHRGGSVWAVVVAVPRRRG